MNPDPPKPPEPSPDPCPECGSPDVTRNGADDLPSVAGPEKHVHVVRLKCKRGHVWSPAR
jgi:hypothetical protein